MGSTGTLYRSMRRHTIYYNADEDTDGTATEDLQRGWFNCQETFREEWVVYRSFKFKLSTSGLRAEVSTTESSGTCRSLAWLVCRHLLLLQE
jgi:hypothetical protein